MTSREKLAALEGRRITVTALIERHGRTTETYLLRHVRDAASGEVLAGHLWIKLGKWANGFRPLDHIEFSARAMPYVKGWMGDFSRAPEGAPMPSLEWGLGCVRDARIITFGPQARMMPDGSVRPLPTDAQSPPLVPDAGGGNYDRTRCQVDD